MLFNRRIIGLDGCELVSTTECTKALFAMANVLTPRSSPTAEARVTESNPRNAAMCGIANSAPEHSLWKSALGNGFVLTANATFEIVFPV
jgi:hypothetical protein